jgi:hypothetical protein
MSANLPKGSASNWIERSGIDDLAVKDWLNRRNESLLISKVLNELLNCVDI